MKTSKNRARPIGAAIALAMVAAACGGAGESPTETATDPGAAQQGVAAEQSEADNSETDSSSSDTSEAGESGESGEATESAATDESTPEESDEPVDPTATPEAEAEAETNTGASTLPAVTLRNLADDGETNLADLGNSETPILFWFWAPH